MWKLLRAELRTLGNTFRTGEGRKALLGYAIVLACLTVGAIVVGANTLLSREVIAAIRDRPDFYLRGVLTIALCGPALFGVMLASTIAGKEMFGSPQTDLLLLAPISRTTIAARAFVRVAFTALSLQLATTLPFVLGFVVEAGLSTRLLLILPLSCLALSAPLVAVVMLGQALVTRFLSGPVVRFCAHALGVIVMLAITAMFLAGITAAKDEARALAQQVVTIRGLWLLVEGPVDLLAGTTPGFPVVALLMSLGMLLLPLPLLFVIGRIYARCREMRLVSHRPVSHRLHSPGRSWPTEVWASIARKDFLDLSRNRAGIVAYLVLSCILLVMLRSLADADHRSPHSSLPRLWQEAFGLLTTWQLLTMILGALHALSFAGDEGKNLPLLATAPITPGDILRGKVPVFVLPFLWTVLVVIVGAPLVAGVSLRAVLIFAAAALPLVAIFFGITAAVSSHPCLFHRPDDVPLGESLSTIGPIMFVSILFAGLLYATYEVKSVVRGLFRAESATTWEGILSWSLLAGALLAGAVLVPWIGLRVARRNLRIVLGPRP